MEKQQISPGVIQAAWTRHRLAIAQIEQTTGRQLAQAEEAAATKRAERTAAEQRVAALRAEEAAAEATAQELRDKHARELSEPAVNLAGLQALCAAQGIDLPQDPPVLPEGAEPVCGDCGQPISPTAGGWTHTISGQRECEPGNLLRVALPAQGGARPPAHEQLPAEQPGRRRS